MLKGYRFLIAAACFALVFVSVGLGVMLATPTSQEDRFQTYRFAADKPLEVVVAATKPTNPEAFQYRAPCEKPKGLSESDLCAQWRAANAAEDNALWAMWGFGVTTITAIGLLITILQGRAALVSAKEANDISRDAVAMQLRPWLSMTNARVFLAHGTILHDQKQEYALCFSQVWNNTGQTPAIDCQMQTHYAVVEASGANGPFPEEIKFGKAVMPSNSPSNSVEFGINRAETDDWIARKVDIILFSRVCFRESIVPHKPHWAESTVRIRFGGWETAPDGIKRVRPEISLDGTRNGMDSPSEF